MLASPFPRNNVAMCVVTAFFVGLIALWRAFLYDFSALGWAAMVAAGACGFVLATEIPERVQRMLVGGIAGFLVVPGVALLALSGRVALIPRALTPPPLLFLCVLTASLAVLGARTIVLRERAARRRARLDEIGADDCAPKQIQRYFDVIAPLRTEMRAKNETFQRTFKRCSRQPDESWERTAEALCTLIVEHRAYVAEWEALPLPAGLDTVRRGTIDAAVRYWTTLEAMAHVLERGGPGGRAALRAAVRAAHGALREVEEANRDWLYATGLASKKVSVRIPRWFEMERKEFAKKPLGAVETV